jgi:hypothetical protein
MIIQKLNELAKLHEINGKNAIDQCKAIVKEELEKFIDDYINSDTAIVGLLIKINKMLKEVE